MNDSKWIEELKVGDVVFVSERYGAPPSRTKVVRLTSARVMVEWGNVGYERAFRKKDGGLVGGDVWSQAGLIQATPEVEAKHELRNALRASVEKLTDLSNKAAASQLTIAEAREVSAFCDAMLGKVADRKAVEG